MPGALLSGQTDLEHIVMSKRFIVLLLVGITAVLFLGSCTQVLPSTPLPTLIPTEHLPTVIAQTAQALVSGSATTTPWEGTRTTTPTVQQSATTLPATLTATVPSITQATNNPGEPTKSPPTESAPEIPFADIQFVSPGALSKVVSPIELHAFLVPGDSGSVRVELFGEDGRLMFRKLYLINNHAGSQANLRSEIDFEISGVAETATLVISVDDTYGRLKALASEELILLSLGESEVNPPDDFLAPTNIKM